MAFSLLPREDSYFVLFERAADAANRGASRLQQLMDDYSQVAAAVNEIKAIEHEGDRVTHETLDKLNRTFITPLEREDIHILVTSIDDILDSLDSAASRLHLYEILEPTHELRQLISVLVEATAVVKDTVSSLSNLKDPQVIFDKCKEIKRLETQSDEILRVALQRLFREEKDALAVMKWKEIYEKLERALDMCEKVANVVEAIVLKHS
ncbi:MAG: DUF47 domain-containing protein [Myxococcales bacterium]